MIALFVIGLGLLPLVHANHLAASEESVSVSVTVTVDWLYPPELTEYPSASEPPASSSSSTSWAGWAPPDPYYPPPPDPYLTSTSTGDGSACQPHRSQWPNASSTPVSTIVTVRPVTITTFTTEVWTTTVVGEMASSSSSPSSSEVEIETETEELIYPVPTWTRCPYASDVFQCGDVGSDGTVVAMKMRDGDEDENEKEGESTVEDDTQPEETDVAIYAEGNAVAGSLWLVMVIIVAML